MQKRRLWRNSILVLLVAVIAGGDVTAAYATTSTSNSTNYQMSEMQFGGGSTLESCSDKYCARASIGDMAAGESKSTRNSATFGSIANEEEPLLEVIVDPGESNLGNLSTEETATKTMTVRIRNYLSDGYMLQIIGDAPKYDGHALNTPSTPTAATPGKEQFAINAAVNTEPNVGAAPLQIPSDQMSFGFVEEDYATPNLFKFTSGDVVARSLSESGRTDYTISMIVNISSSTPAGHYTGDFSAVVIPVF